MLIEVTQKDIDLGVRENCDCCPIAMACKRAIEPLNLFNVSMNVNGLYILFICKDRREVVSRVTPPEAVEFIRQFDSHAKVEPFSFELADFTPKELAKL